MGLTHRSINPGFSKERVDDNAEASRLFVAAHAAVSWRFYGQVVIHSRSRGRRKKPRKRLLRRQRPRSEAPEAPAPLSSDELDQLVAPIALYPDALVAQILAGSTYPTEVVEAARWQGANPGLSGDSLAAAVDSQDWDPSIKALTQFPSVLANMNNNLSWTSALGQAYYYQPEDVLNAVQVMRQRALAARTLVNTPQQTVVDQNGVIMIEPVNPDEVYVPNYNPGVIYGAPEPVYPGYSMGEMIGAGALAFGAGIAVGVLANQAWGWHGWNTDWHHRHVIYQNNAYVSNSNTFSSVGGYGGGNRGGGNFNRGAGNSRQGGYNARRRRPSAGRRRSRLQSWRVEIVRPTRIPRKRTAAQAGWARPPRATRRPAPEQAPDQGRRRIVRLIRIPRWQIAVHARWALQPPRPVRRLARGQPANPWRRRRQLREITPGHRPSNLVPTEASPRLRLQV